MNARDMLSQVEDFQSAFGRLCVLAAQALADGQPRESVRVAFLGHGDNIRLGHIRAARVEANIRADRAKEALAAGGVEPFAAVRRLVERASVVRTVVEAEWGVKIPFTDPRT